MPLIAEIERLIVSGRSWSKEFESRADEVSIALFGITKADTLVATDGVDPATHNWDMAAVERETEARCDLEDELTFPADNSLPLEEMLGWWDAIGFDVEDAPGSWLPLRCLYLFGRQMIAAIGELMPGAKLTLDGTGTRAALSAEAWGGSLAADAAKFMGRRR